MLKRILAARHYQRRDSALRLMALKAKPAIRKDFKGALAHLGDLVPRARALQHARAGDWHGLKALIPWSHFREVLKAPLGRVVALRHAAAALGVKKINGSFSQARRQVRFRKSSEMDYASDVRLGRVRQGLARSGSVRHGVGEAAVDESVGGSSLDQIIAEVGSPMLKALFSISAVSVRKDVGDKFNFDIYGQATQDRIRQAQDKMIRELETTARNTIDTIVAGGARAGLGPDAIVDDIRSMISLTDRQAQAVMNYRGMLENLDPTALERQLRNKASDDEVQAAIDAGEDLSDVAIDRLTEDYLSNYLEFRSEQIAQTESTRAVAEGLSDAYQQAIDRGALPEDAVTRNWQLGDHPCPICESIPDANPDGVGVNEPFDSIDGPIDNPPVHVGCFCSVEYVTDLDKVPDDSEG